MSQTTELRNDARKDPETLEREIDTTRAQMGQTLGALERKLSPGQLVDEVFGVVRQHGGEIASNLGQQIKQNPLPFLVTAIGLGWMMFSSNRPERRGSYVNAADTYGTGADQYGAELQQYRAGTGDYGHVSGDYATSNQEQRSESESHASTVAEYGYQIGDYGSRVKDKLAGAGESLRSGTTQARTRVANTLASSKDAVVRRVSSSASAAQDRAARLRYSAQEQAGRLRHNVSNLMDEQPLILGALGVAIGAAVGAALPATEQENRVLGPIRDQTVSQIKERGAEAYEQARNTAEQAMDTLKERATAAAQPSNVGGTQKTANQAETAGATDDFLITKDR